MPFEIAPVEAPVRTSPYKRFADAMQQGCKRSYPVRGLLFSSDGGACAMGALYLGLGAEPHSDVLPFARQAASMELAYAKRYGKPIAADNDDGAFTREQIAERIAAL